MKARCGTAKNDAGARPGGVKMRYADSNFFIYAAADRGKEGQRAREMLEKMADNHDRIASSVLVLDEVAWELKRKIGSRNTIEYCLGLLADPAIHWIDATPRVLKKSFELMEAFGLDPRDAIHAASCLSEGLTEIITEDRDFDKIRGLRRIAYLRGT